jgi:tRNA pseudouridine13 synthase
MEPRLITDPPIAKGQPDDDKKAAEAEAAEKKRKREEEQNKQKLAQSDWDALQKSLSELVGSDPAAETIQFLQSMEEDKNKKQLTEPMEAINEQQYNVSLPPVSDKETRRNLHQWVRENLSGIARSDTVDDDKSQKDKIIRIWHERFTRKMPNWKAFEKEKDGRSAKYKVAKPPPGKKFLKFVLYKENMDTTLAINQISRGGGRKLRLGYAGMKDKRGITCQFVTVPAHTPIHSLTKWNTSQRNRGGGHTQNQGVGVLRVGCFEYVEEDLRMGRLLGNRFDIALRNIQSDDLSRENMKTHLQKAATSLKNHGFINYFGVQRFGKFHDTHLVGIEVLKGNYEKAIDIIMEPKPSEREEMTVSEISGIGITDTRIDLAIIFLVINVLTVTSLISSLPL